MTSPITPAVQPGQTDVFLGRREIIWDNPHLNSLGDPTRADPVHLIQVTLDSGTVLVGTIDVCRLTSELNPHVSVGVHITWNNWQPGSSRLVAARWTSSHENIHNDWRRWRTRWVEHHGEREETRWKEERHIEQVEEEYMEKLEEEIQVPVERQVVKEKQGTIGKTITSTKVVEPEEVETIVDMVKQLKVTMIPKKRMVPKEVVTHTPYTVMVPYTWHTEESYQIPLEEYHDPEPMVDRYVFEYDLTRDVPLDSNVKKVWLQMAAYHRFTQQQGGTHPFEFWDSDFGKNHHMSCTLPSSFEFNLAREMLPTFNMPQVKRSKERSGLNRRYNQMSKEAGRYLRRVLELGMSGDGM